ncbi:beta-ketoacyl synthase [Dyadobacter sp. CY261]|uniref:beta-ketoacyl synthase N-terminal-like domain-containing protein n=1 Tax=Dyadobacter sp. CY261 TaxID=2907203 RepID=UPI001F350DE0|nr:beta-ketoacyl synthase N-terminal-like domain-containing protein [Dyadobacter sp. CY261]MCF0073793.1 beta-ketoacyl synthase [Dyadobacter sp. CY261]
MIYIGAEVIVSPLGDNAEDNWQAISANRSGIALVPSAGFNGEDIHLARIAALNGSLRFQQLVVKALSTLVAKIDASIVSSDRTMVLISSTKGALDDNINDQFSETNVAVQQQLGLAHLPMVISNACISGVLALNAAGNMIKNGQFEHVIVVGCDLASDFVLYGFQSLFAVSDKPCAPFDAARNGITLGEGSGAVLVSGTKSVFKDPPLELLTGTSANDANHISGPSRTGEGLVRSVLKTLRYNDVSGDEIDFISAHGTGTIFNDEMESIAFDSMNLSHIPLNSLKGYYGHTLGAAGVIETTVSMQMIRNGMLLESLGYLNNGVSRPLNIITKNTRASLKTVLKTASGFGGGNASLLIRKI